MSNDVERDEWIESEVPAFTMVWNELILDTSISDGAVRLYAVLHQHCRQERAAWPSRKRLAELLGKSVPTVQARLRELVEAGWITVTERFHDDGGGQRSNLYRLRMRPVRVESADSAEANGVQDPVPPPDKILSPPRTGFLPQKYKQSKQIKEKDKPSQPDGYDASPDPQPTSESFHAFWQAYPRHATTGQRGGGGSKQQAQKVWKRMSQDQQAAAQRSVEAYRRHVESREGPWPAHAATWLRQERYRDWEDVVARGDLEVGRTDGLRAVMR